MKGQTERALALHPTSKGFGYGVLEGSERLVDWGLVQVSTWASDSYLLRFAELCDRYLPEVLIIEDGRSSRLGPRAKARMQRIEEGAWSRSIEVVKVCRGKVRQSFKDTGTTKWEIAEAITRWFPELAPRLPKRRKPWMSEDRRMAIFDAVSFALTALREREWTKAE